MAYRDAIRALTPSQSISHRVMFSNTLTHLITCWWDGMGLLCGRSLIGKAGCQINFMDKRIKNRIGMKFGRLTVLFLTDTKSKQKRAYWMCLCDCGEFKEVPSSRLRNGETRSCGCIKKEWVGEKNPNWKGGISKNNYHYKKLQIQRYPEKVAARMKLRREVSHGRIKKPDHCSKCKQKCKPHGHHEDYEKPLDVIWVCRPCHREIHGGKH